MDTSSCQPGDASKPIDGQCSVGNDDPLLESLRRARELDRARIAHTIHDHFGLLLMLVRMRLRSASTLTSGLSGDDQVCAAKAAILAELGAAEAVLKQLSDAARQLQNDLNPTRLDGHGLRKAFEALQATFAGAGLNVVLRVDSLENRRFPNEFETTTYWLTQHALTNVLRHSGSNRASVTADTERGPGGETLHIVIEDRGKGFVMGEIGSTFGLTAMYDRATLIGGTVIIDSVPGRGTRVVLNLPTDFKPVDALVEKNSEPTRRG